MFCRLLAVAALVPFAARGAIIGTNPPAMPLTEARIARLPLAEQPAWRAYLERSTALRRADQASLARELQAAGLKEPLRLPESHFAGRKMLGRSEAFYASAEARLMADNVVTFQTPAGGWSKNFDPTNHARRPGESYAPNNNSRFLAAGDNDQPEDPQWNYIATIDNDATTTELRFLAKVAAKADAGTGARWRASFRRGLEYLYAAQFPNGGWPQVFPLDGGYHDEITFNDDAVINVVEVLRDVATGAPDYAWLAADDRRRAAAASERALRCILRCQMIVAGERTVWCQQNDELTFVPASARNYEMPALSSGESASITEFLMSLPHPAPEVVAAVHGAARWMQATAIRDMTWGRAPDGRGRTLVRAPGKGPWWPRFSEIGTNRPLFGDRDKSIHDRLEEISSERRNGYAWYGNGPERVLAAYPAWAAAHPSP